MHSGMRWMLATALGTILSSGGGVQGQQAQGQDVSPQTCGLCHGAQVAAFARNPHASLDSEGLAERAGARFSCEACHGDPSPHLQAGGGASTIRTFRDDTPVRVIEETCLACHAATHPEFPQSPHAFAGVSCLQCHSIHDAPVGSAHLLAPPPSETVAPGTYAVSALCARCHGDVLAQFQFNERHRLEENILECTSCHDPHAPAPRTLLAGFKQQACVQCHTDKGGPFVFEHGSVMVEGCVACHDPHAGANRHQLQFQRVAELCVSCHIEVPSFHSRFTLDTQCTNCHSSIHGSNFDPYFLQ